MGDTASYAPRSPDLSGASYAPRSPDLSGASYAPQRSPNLGGYSLHGAADVPLQPLAHAQTSNPYLNVPPIQTAFHPESPVHAGAKRTRRSLADDPAYEPSPKTPGRGRKPKKMKVEEEEEEDFGKPAPGVAEGIEVKTKFPVAKIKRIMQHDDEVGKVAQVTPTAVSKALELFMISIVTKAANVAREKNSKKVTVSHMKQVVKEVSEFDFLTDVCDKYTDTSNKKGRGKKEPEESD